MPDVIGELLVTAIAATGEAEGLVAFGEATYLGVSGFQVIGSAALLATTIGLSYALRQGVPKPEDGSIAVKQSVPSRIFGYGTNRLAGCTMLEEAGGPAPATAYVVQALHSGRIGEITSVYLHDDLVVIDGDISHGGFGVVEGTFSDDRYTENVIQLETRIGTPGQTALASFVGDPFINALWTAQHVGNGIAYIGMSCYSTNDPAKFSRIFPRGLPQLSVIAQCSPCWDPRDETQDRFNEATWLVSYNPVIQTIDYLTRVDGGMGLDLDIILPPVNLALWMEEADICDAVVDVAGGGLERRYESDGWFLFDNKPEDVIGGLLSTCDGWLAESGDGTLSLTVGLYRTPVDPPLTEKHFLPGFTVNFGQSDETIVNQLDITFTDPLSKYVSVQTDPWRDEVSISLTGTVRSQPLDLKWVQSYSQARRLAGRAMQRLNGPMTGSFQTTLYGLRYLGKRWVHIQYPFVSGLQDCVVEIQNAEVDLMAGKISWDFIRIVPETIEAYDPDSNQGNPPVTPPSGSGLALLREDGSQYIREDGTVYSRETT